MSDPDDRSTADLEGEGSTAEGARDDESPPEGWTVWNDEPGGQYTLAFRPDVFTGETLPAACMPTVVVTRRHPDRNPRSRGTGGWHVLCYLEPAVRVRSVEAREPDRETALATARDVAAAFVAGDVDYRGAYAQPRAAYLDQLDDLLDGADGAGAAADPGGAGMEGVGAEHDGEDGDDEL